jgi:hypothetical protein
MSGRAKIILYATLILCAIVLGTSFSSEYSRVTSGVANASNSKMMAYLGGLICVVVVLGVIGAYDIVRFMGDSAEEFLFSDAEEEKPDPEYLAAEKICPEGDPLEAIRLLREYYQKNPRDTKAAVRIAEIYDKDLKNQLAAVLEYEEVLKLRLSPDRWGWVAIHLCNLYSKMREPDKAVALLRRIANEYGETSAAEKARERLAKFDPDFETQPAEEKLARTPPEAPPPSAGPPASNLPPGFRPKT